jgi:hypothetical protein
MKHNKKRNTAFLYECLIRELTKAIIKEDKTRQTLVKRILRESFQKGKPLKTELELYSSILETSGLTEAYSTRLMVESRKDFDQLDRKEIFNEQTSLINRINKYLGAGSFNNFIPNYKDVASVGLFFQGSSLGPKKRIMLEDRISRYLTGSKVIKEEMAPIGELEFKMFTKRFNETYDESLLKEQKELLGNFITSFADNGLALKVYLNDEIGRLKEAVDSEIIANPNSVFLENFQKVRAKLDKYAEVPLNKTPMEEIFHIQELLSEVRKNAV